MHPLDHIFPASHTTSADVGTPQVENLVWRSYQSENLSDKVTTGRAISAFNSEQVPDSREDSEAHKERWSRGCRRAHVWFWFWQWFRLSPLAPRKKKSWLSRSPSNRLTPASTNNLPERACRFTPVRPAPTLGLLRHGAVCRLDFPNIAGLNRCLWAAPRLSPIRAVDLSRRQDRC